MRSRKSEFFDEWTDTEVSDIREGLEKAISELGPRSYLRKRLIRYLRWFEIENNKRDKTKIAGSIKPSKRKNIKLGGKYGHRANSKG